MSGLGLDVVLPKCVYGKKHQVKKRQMSFFHRFGEIYR
jgi:hypothetical protein